MSGWPKRRKLARASLWEYSCKRLKLAPVLGHLGVSFSLVRPLGVDVRLGVNAPAQQPALGQRADAPVRLEPKFSALGGQVTQCRYSSERSARTTSSAR